MGDKKIVVHFTVLTFCMNIPFAVYILSPAIASYIILRKIIKYGMLVNG